MFTTANDPVGKVYVIPQYASGSRLFSDSLTMTQELIVNMLGVRREGITEAARNLQRADSRLTTPG